MLTNRAENEKKVDEEEVKVYKRRWFILLLFTFYSMCSSAQWLQYAIIENVVTSYYNVSTNVVNWTSINYMVSFVVFIFPAMYIVEKYGLRTALLTGATLLTLGSTLKVFSVARDQFTIGFCGHVIVGISQVFMLSLPSKVASVWFPPEQLSTACSISFVGLQAGVALGITMSTSVGMGANSINDYEKNFKYLFYSMAVYSGIIFILMVIFMKGRPPTPPSQAEVKRLVKQKSNFLHSLKIIQRNSNFRLMTLASAINEGVFYAISTLLNQILLQVFKNDEVFAGRIGSVLILFSVIGSFLTGIILDKTHSFKQITHISNFGFAICLLGLSAACASGQQVAVYGVSLFLGLFLGMSIVAFIEFSMEIFYPEEESTITGILFASFQIVGIVLTPIWGWILKNYPAYWGNILACVLLLIGNGIIQKIPKDYRRQDSVSKGNKLSENKEAIHVEMKLLSVTA